MARVRNHGTLILIEPENDAEREWLKKHTDGQWLGGALAVEPRYAGTLLLVLREAFNPSQPED